MSLSLQGFQGPDSTGKTDRTQDWLNGIGTGGGYLSLNTTTEGNINRKLAEQNPMIAAGLTNVTQS